MTCYKVVMTCHWTSLVKIKCWICLLLRPALIIYMFVVLRPKFFIVGSSFFFNFLDNPIIKIFFHILRKINIFHIIDTKTQSKWVFNMICTINFFKNQIQNAEKLLGTGDGSNKPIFNFDLSIQHLILLG